MVIDEHVYWMRYSLMLAKKSKYYNEVPVGAVIVLNNILVSKGRNKLICKKDVTAHAEINAIRKANLLINNYRLSNFSIYVTLEPCIMCLGAIINSRISNLYFGAKNYRFSVISFLKSLPKKNKLNIFNNILEKECSIYLKNFFLKCR